MKKLCIALSILLSSTLCFAQSVQQSGNVTPTHPAYWVTNGVIGDAGTASNGALSGVGVTASGPGICQNSDVITNPYTSFCMGVSASGGGVFYIQNHGGNPATGISFNINGAPANFSLVISPTVAGDGACFGNTTGTLIDCGGAPVTSTIFITCPANQWVNAISAIGSVCAPIAFSNLSSTPTTLAGYGIASPLPLAQGGSAQATVLAARSSSGFDIDACTSTGDANYGIQATDRCVYHTALSVARTDTLPAANSLNPGQTLVVNDFRGVASGTNTITLQRAGADTINGSTTAVAVNVQYGWATYMSDGVSRWTFQAGSSGGGGGVTSIVCATTTITTTGNCYLRGQIVGTNTNDNATAGNFGEYTSSSIPGGSAVNLAVSGTAYNVTSVSLSAGDWDCRGNAIGIGAGSTVRAGFYTWISTTSASFPALPNGGAYSQLVVTTPAGSTTALAVAPAQFLLSGTTTVYLSVISVFSISTDSASGFLGCRRVR